MGSSKYVTIKQACKMLGVSERSIYRYATRGILETKTEGRHVLILEDSILTMKKGKHDILSSPVNRASIGKLQAEVQTLRTQMATVQRILNIRSDPFDFTVPEWDLIYKTAEQLSIEGWSPHQEDMWADYFVRFNTEDFEKIEMATGDKHPWRPFLRLASTMYLNPWNKELTGMFAAGKTHLQQVAGVWCVLKEESPRTLDLLTERDAAPFKKLVRRLNKAQKSEEPS